MPQQTVFRLPQRTGIENLTTIQEPIPSPTKHEVIIKIYAVSLNARDLQIAKNEYPLPANDSIIPCSDGAGEITEVGEGANYETVTTDKYVRLRGSTHPRQP
ncbi:uncharacterized protein BDV17DRAFT_291793 [Aspergillus undulatus]|uniref:uncharacterized protein n=1 Tax=Aspergillus undulatus TaxID=1810928 RepID=UPI003CCE0696